MNGPSHYEQAELLLDQAESNFNGDDREHALALWQARQAQVHATLALAGAYGVANFGAMPPGDSDLWLLVAGKDGTP